MKLARIDRNAIRMMDQDIQSALKEVGDKYGVAISIDGGSFTTTTYNPKITFAVKDASGEAQTFEARTLKQLYPQYVGKLFYHPRLRMNFRVTGYNSRAPKYPFQLELTNGDRRKAPESFLRFATEVKVAA